MIWYLLFEWLHVLLAILAVGSNATTAVWMMLARQKPEAVEFTLKGIKTINDKIANRAYAGLLVTGVIMMFIAPYSLTTPWLLVSIILYVGLLVVGMAGYAPALRSQIKAVETNGFDSAEYKAASNRGRMMGILIVVLAIVIVFFMVVKPALWG